MGPLTLTVMGDRMQEKRKKKYNQVPNQETKENIYNGITIQNIKISDFVCLNPNRLINNRCFCVQSILQIIKEALYITTGTQMYIQMHVCTHTHAQAHELFPKQN